MLSGAYSGNASGTCDAAFTYQTAGNGQYYFSGNQIRQGGYTYFDKWTVNGNRTSLNSSFNYSFYLSGVYNVCHAILIQDSAGATLCRDSSCVPVQVIINPSCLLHFAVNYSNTGNYTAQFTNTLNNYTNVSLRWNFGDGTMVNGIASPSHQYAGGGAYTVWLVATDTVAHCSDSASCVAHINAAYSCHLFAGFYGEQSAFNAPAFNFAVDSNAGIYQIALWNFGDGTSSALDSNTHLFPAFGSYNVCLTLTDTIHGCSSNNCFAVEVDSCNAQMGAISLYINGNTINVAADGILNRNITPAYFTWNFGDGSTDIFDLSTTHTYSAIGAHTCCFSVDITGCATMDTCVTVMLNCQLSVRFGETELNSLTEEFVVSSANYSNLKYHWTFGDGTSGNNDYPQHVYAQPGFYNVCLYTSDTITGCKDTLCQIMRASIWSDTICGNAFVDLNLNGIQDSTDLPLAGAPITVTIYNSNASVLHTVTDSAGFYSLAVPVNSLVDIDLNFTGTVFYTLPFVSLYSNVYSYYSYQFTSANMRQCGFDFGISTNSATIGGRVFADLNHDSIFDAGDVGLPNQVVEVGNQSVMTTSYGIYSAVVPLGATIIKRAVGGYYDNYQVLPSQIPLNISTAGSHNYSCNLAVEVNSDSLDVAVDLFPTSPVSMTGLADYKLLVSNISVPNAYYQANIVSDTALALSNYTWGFTSNNPARHTTSWIDNLPSFTQKIYDAFYNLSPTAVINQDIYNTAGIEVMIGNDSNRGNDTDICHQIVVASFDPNGKTSNQAGVGPQGFINGDKAIDYVIDFQNTGTSDAENVIVRDIISLNLDLKTFRWLASSRNCDIRLTGDTIYFRFSHIALSFGGEQDTGSQGWLAFSIKPKPNLPPLTQITNTAAIYFDHNAPVVTNTTLHTIFGPEAIFNFYNDGQLKIAPNPFSAQTMLELRDVPDVTYRYAIYDVVGREINSGELRVNVPVTVLRNDINSGTYILTVYNGTNVVDRAKLIAY